MHRDLISLRFRYACVLNALTVCIPVVVVFSPVSILKSDKKSFGFQANFIY